MHEELIPRSCLGRPRTCTYMFILKIRRIRAVSGRGVPDTCQGQGRVRSSTVLFVYTSPPSPISRSGTTRGVELCERPWPTSSNADADAEGDQARMGRGESCARVDPRYASAQTRPSPLRPSAPRPLAPWPRRLAREKSVPVQFDLCEWDLCLAYR